MKLNQYEQYLFDLANEIVKFLVKNGSSVEDAQDIAQESIIKLLEIDNIIPPEKLRSWLYKVSLINFIIYIIERSDIRIFWIDIFVQPLMWRL